jgi:hypothetical protein
MSTRFFPYLSKGPSASKQETERTVFPTAVFSAIVAEYLFGMQVGKLSFAFCIVTMSL